MGLSTTLTLTLTLTLTTPTPILSFPPPLTVPARISSIRGGRRGCRHVAEAREGLGSAGGDVVRGKGRVRVSFRV